MFHQANNNFLEEKYFKQIKDFFFGEKCLWSYRPHQTKNDDGFFFFFIFLNFQPVSSSFNLLEPLLNKLTIKQEDIIQIRANLLISKPKHKYSEFHIDCKTNENFTTAIFYLNTCNGSTIFEKNNTEIKSEENKLLVFNGNLKHQAKSQTDTYRRIVINFNFINGEKLNA